MVKKLSESSTKKSCRKHISRSSSVRSHRTPREKKNHAQTEENSLEEQT